MLTHDTAGRRFYTAREVGVLILVTGKRRVGGRNSKISIYGYDTINRCQLELFADNHERSMVCVGKPQRAVFTACVYRVCTSSMRAHKPILRQCRPLMG